MKIVFMGTPDFAVPALKVLMSEHEVVCVYTQAPKEAGRGNKLTKTPVHLLPKPTALRFVRRRACVMKRFSLLCGNCGRMLQWWPLMG